MKSTPHVLRLTSALAAVLLASACGGGGGNPNLPNSAPVNPAPVNPSNPANPTPAIAPSTDSIPAPPAGCQVHVVADPSVAEGKTGSASVLSCGTPLRDVLWSQVSGPAVDLLARRSPTVSFESASAGTVVLRADATLSTGATTSVTATVPVLARPAGSFITVRADHAVRPQGDTSVRAWPTLTAGETVTRITWTQTAGPSVTMNTADQSVLMFTAPAASSDTALRFRATLTTSTGRTDSDDVTITLDRPAAAPADPIFESAARVYPYRQAAQYAPVLVRCAYDQGLYFKDNGENNLCSSATLPLLQTEAGQDAIPSVEQVMGRVLVSHDFLGANFEQFLTTQDPHGDFRRLFASATAIVIGSHVRPSFYTPATGAIYLDAGYLWLTPAQRDVVTEVPDYRSEFDDQLNFTVVGRLVRNGAYARRFIGATDRVTRSSDELLLDLGRLLYHELAHASDFMPPEQRGLAQNLSIWSSIAPLIGNRLLPSDALAAGFPLQSSEMKGLGQVMYLGATASAQQRSYTAEEVGGFFAGDVASDDYAYSINGQFSSREDLAMLFEEFMMSYRHGVRYDFGYTSKFKDGMNSDQLIVGWGQRGRIAEPAVKPRIKLVLQRIARWIDPSAVDSLPAPVMLQRGANWEASVTVPNAQGAALSSRSAARIESASAREARRRDALRRGHHSH